MGVDEDFGKAPELLKTVDTPPYYGIVNNPESNSADNGGLLVDGHYQVVDANNEPIPHLFAAGVDAGDLCGGINWKNASRLLERPQHQRRPLYGHLCADG